uniref:TD and POZ domain-containing protein 4 n=1 Tax=Lygus hesperus TaxID=30085 RepID=A0A0A9YUL4_LYGHE
MTAAVEPDFSFDHIKSSCLKLELLRQGQKLSDVDFLVDGKRFEAHKIVLAAVSPVFLAMFESGMKECISNEIVLTDTDPEGFENFLKFVYSGGVPDMKHVVTLVNLADKYHVLALFDLCVDFMGKTLNECNVSERLQLAELHGVASLKTSCLDFIRDHLESVSSSEGWARIVGDLRLTSQVAQALQSTPVETTTPEEFVQVSETKELVCQTPVKTVQWSIKWATVLNHELLRDPASPTPIKTENFNISFKDGNYKSFYLYLSKKETKYYGTEVTFWLKMDTTEDTIVDFDCLAVLHSAVPNGEYRRRLKFSFKPNKNPKKPFTKDRQIVSFRMSDGHFSIDNAIKLTLVFQQHGDIKLIREPEQPPKMIAKLARTDEFSDVAFDVGGTEFLAHRVVLAGSSDFFKKLFKEDPKSKYVLKNVDPDVFQTILNFLYSGNFPEPRSIGIDLLEMAAIFSLVDLANYCSLAVAENITVDNAIRLLKVSGKTGATKLKDPVLKFIGSNLDDVIASAGWQTLKNKYTTVTELLLGLSRMRAEKPPDKPSVQEKAVLHKEDISINFKPELFEDYFW